MNINKSIFWILIPELGSIKYSYDQIVEKDWGNKWYCHSTSEMKVGDIVIFGIPKKIIDIFEIVGLKENYIFLSRCLATILWRNLPFIPPIQDYYYSIKRLTPVKIDFSKNKKVKKWLDKIIREISN